MADTEFKPGDPVWAWIDGKRIEGEVVVQNLDTVLVNFQVEGPPGAWVPVGFVHRLTLIDRIGGLDETS